MFSGFAGFVCICQAFAKWNSSPKIPPYLPLSLPLSLLAPGSWFLASGFRLLLAELLVFYSNYLD